MCCQAGQIEIFHFTFKHVIFHVNSPNGNKEKESAVNLSMNRYKIIESLQINNLLAVWLKNKEAGHVGAVETV